MYRQWFQRDISSHHPIFSFQCGLSGVSVSVLSQRVFEGDRFCRDGAYHRGTVWPWLIGPYAEAVLRTGKFSDKAKQDATSAITPLLKSMVGDGDWPGIGQLFEIHDADPPFRPVGCPAQAWSVAEVLRILRLIETGGG